MIINNLEKAVNNLLQGWLGASEGVSVYVKQRHAFDNALKIALIERFYMMGFEDAMHLEHLSSITTNNSNNIVVTKSINTDYIYHPCIDYDTDGKKINHINIDLKLQLLFGEISQISKKNFNNAYLLLVVFPCTNTDKNWTPHLEKIKSIIDGELFGLDFRFTNNAPGVIYFGRLDTSEAGLHKSRNLMENYRNLTIEDTLENESTKKSRERVGLSTNSYYDILYKIHIEMLTDKSVMSITELQTRFQNEVIQLKKIENPKITSNEIESIIDSFNSNGSGAKKAQILLNTINEPNRIHYRPYIDQISKFNLFVYVEDENLRVPFRNKKIKAFNINDKNILDKTLYYSKKAKLGEKRVAIGVKVKDSELMKNK
jgi:hypothetical protein